MNLNIWKYRYRRLRSLKLVDFTRRWEIRSWRKQILDYVTQHSGYITSPSINAWLNHIQPSPEMATPDNFDINGRPPGFLCDPDFWKTFRRLYPEETEQLLDLASDVLRGKVQLFGWNPVSSAVPSLGIENAETMAIVANWASTNYWDINFYHSKTSPDFDIKWLWELQRLQFLLWLGAAWQLTGDSKFAVMAREILASWLSHLRYPLGVEWSSNLEVGLRILSISRCSAMLMNSPAWDQEFVSTLLAWNRLHATHLRKEITLHHALGNHQLGEACSLIWFASVFPGLPEANLWNSFALKTINRIVPDLFFPDGVYAEQSNGYLKFALEFMFPLISNENVSVQGFSSITLKRLISSLEFIQAQSNCGRNVPMVGDSDSGSAIGWRLAEYWDFSWLLAVGATMFNRADLADGIEKFPAEAFLNTGLHGLEKFRDLKSRSIQMSISNKIKPSRYRSFPTGGYHISRDSYFQLIFDSGPLGIPPGFGHGHADALSILINVENKPVIVDPGTMHYNAQPEVRTYFRETSAHNTLMIGRASQSEVLDTFRWVSDYRVQWIDAIETREFRVLSGTLATNFYSHQRTVLHRFEMGLIISDVISVQGDSMVQGHLHFHPNINIKPMGRNKFLLSHGKNLLEISLPQSPHVSSELIEGAREPMLGWYSGSYGQMVSTKTVRFKFKILNRGELITVIERPKIHKNWNEELLFLKSIRYREGM